MRIEFFPLKKFHLGSYIGKAGNCIAFSTSSVWQPPGLLNIGQGNWKTNVNQVLEDLPGLGIKDTRAGNNRETWKELMGNLNFMILATTVKP